MLKNYLNIAIRNLTKHRFYSIINILGLSIGLSCFLFIALFVQDELTYDKHIENQENIYRFDFNGVLNGNDFNTALMCAPASQTMIDEFPEVEDAFRFRVTGSWFLKQEGTMETFKLQSKDITYSDPNFFKFWKTKMIKGDPETCLSRPNTVVLDQTMARKVFGDIDPIGKTVVLDNRDKYEVTGVYQDLPKNSHFHFRVMLTMLDREEAYAPMWLGFNFNTYLKFKDGADIAAFESKLPELVTTKIGPDLEKYMNTSFEEMVESGNKFGFYIIPLADIHLGSNKLGEIETNGDLKYIYIFSAIGVFILLLACINFMNLATARSAGRAKEVGIRKVMGAVRGQLVRQFLSEAVIISLISTVLGLFICSMLMPYFNAISGKHLATEALYSPEFLVIILIISLMAGMLAGSYPAFYLSRFRPAETLKGRLNLGMKSGRLRSVLVVVQFVISITMIIGTAIVYDQLSFIQNTRLGFNREQVIAVDDVWILGDKESAFKEEVIRDSRISSGALASFVPIGSDGNNSVYWKGNAANQEDSYVINHRRVDYDYVQTMQMKLVAGRNFSREYGSDSLSIIVNESLVKQMGIKDPIGFGISTYETFGDDEKTVKYTIIGVMEDFHYQSMKEDIDPILFRLYEKPEGMAVFRFNSEDTKAVVDHIEKVWEEIAPGQPFDYFFLDQRFASYYESEQRIGQIFLVFAFLTIFIACLGLLGLASFTAEQRVKEIGVRKVLGASAFQIVSMLSWNFIKLIGLAFLVAAPIAYLGMRQWLDQFVYRTELNIWIFIIAGLLSAGIAWMTMGLQSYIAASVNPSRSLRSE
ncbi:ABC transporter permease [Marinoscillum sp. MHG1-6]|uniref:ABC transporter permease n=1 Tax=Marinoscillum sp. MHG1-6 TaxID=2959627 RepID=UPI0021581BBA|nr:ABC transporter permease [Marinoscillum sp. MHG1-6]